MSKVFQLDGPKATDNFKFRMPGSKVTHELPSLQKPTSKQTSDLLDFQLDLLEHYVPGITSQLDDDMFMALMEAWKEHSEISMGE